MKIIKYGLIGVVVLLFAVPLLNRFLNSNSRDVVGVDNSIGSSIEDSSAEVLDESKENIEKYNTKWEQYINSDLGFAIEFPAEYSLSLTKSKMRGAYEGNIIPDDAAQTSATPVATVHFYEDQDIDAFEQIDKRITNIDEANYTINNQNVRMQNITKELSTGVEVEYPIYYIQSGINAVVVTTYEHIDWEKLEQVSNTVQTL